VRADDGLPYHRLPGHGGVELGFTCDYWQLMIENTWFAEPGSPCARMWAAQRQICRWHLPSITLT
jgi:hypothetical protein